MRLGPSGTRSHLAEFNSWDSLVFRFLHSGMNDAQKTKQKNPRFSFSNYFANKRNGCVGMNASF